MTTLHQLIVYLNSVDCSLSYGLYRGEMAFHISKAGRKAHLVVNENNLLDDFETFKREILDPAVTAIHRRM